ncbi:AraC family transcriptional regulator [Actinobacillus lignieresii]|uniref:Putative HTH-type transcriptional regulator n=1 Tax=Actinobacillus lignieresii TaxID=720 RepID=A0A380TYM6_ACTLI|nr:AraC family transcriptional regulator [Actinobacillus lignieresii]SUT93690.1 putative HTH-type transcriptional regulator [Actinobacillus lignieresii]
MQIIDKLLPLVPKNQVWQTPIDGFVIQHADRPTPVANTILEPRICIVLQGERKICVGDQCTLFSNKYFMFCPVNVPLSVEVVEASPEKPYLMMTMKIDLKMVASIVPHIPKSIAKNQTKSTAFLKWQLEENLLAQFEHLIDLLKTPEDIDFLAPLIQQQIYYVLLKSNQGQKLRELVNEGSHTQRIAQTAFWIEQHLSEPLRVDDLAKQAGMSVSGFHSHFKKMTNMSPLQYQKSHRLLAAQRLIQAKQSNIASVAFQVGYESPSQFSREYKRHFGVSPKGDAS